MDEDCGCLKAKRVSLFHCGVYLHPKTKLILNTATSSEAILDQVVRHI